MKKIIIFYDNWCPNCTRFSNLIKKLDWLNLLTVKELRNEIHLADHKGIDITLAKQQMASFINKWNYGFKTIYLMIIRIPVFFPLIPFLFLLNISGCGQFLYMHLAVNRKIIPLHCNSDSCGLGF